MILHFIGGRDDGLVLDLDDPPPGWCWTEDLRPPMPDTLEMHSCRANRAVYRLTAASVDECTYQLDPTLTAEYKSRR